MAQIALNSFIAFFLSENEVLSLKGKSWTKKILKTKYPFFAADVKIGIIKYKMK